MEHCSFKIKTNFSQVMAKMIIDNNGENVHG